MKRFLSAVDSIDSLGAIIIIVALLLGVLVGLMAFLVFRQDKRAFLVDGKTSPDKETQNSRFFSLTKIDRQKAKFQRKQYPDQQITLEQFCNDFCNFSASNLKLYYDISDIRKFICSLAVSRIIVLQGISGTGKTSLAYAFGEFISNSALVMPIQPMWKERTDLIGYYNEFTKRFNETALLSKMYEANYSKDIYITLLDEMNIARIEYYFAEFLSLLELPNPKRRYLDVVNDQWQNDPKNLVDGRIKLPENMWFIGTANNDDTTFSISDKVYDRAMILNLDRKAEPFDGKKVKPISIKADDFCQLFVKAQDEFELTRRNLARLKKLDQYLIENFCITFGNRIKKQILSFVPVYIACGGSEIEALDDIIAKKLLRKLEMQNPSHIRNIADSFCLFLDQLFGLDKMVECKSYINLLAKRG